VPSGWVKRHILNENTLPASPAPLERGASHRHRAVKLDFDVVVVGGGPGGSTAAKFCAQAGLKTLLVEKERFPRYKPCGGCLSQKALRFLDLDLGPIIERTLDRVRFTYGLKDPLIIRARQPIGFMVMRDRFDHFLIQKAAEKKVEILDGERIVTVEETEEAIVVVTAKGRKVVCQYLIGADGPMSRVAQSISLAHRDPFDGGLSLECEIPFSVLRDIPPEVLEEIHLDFGGIPNGYGWVFPKKDGLSVGIGGMLLNEKKVNIRRCFSTFLEGIPYVPREGVVPWVGHLLPAFYDEGQRIARRRILLVGDAAHLMDPLMGEGIFYAVRSGMLAAEAILQSKQDGAEPADFYHEAVRVHIFNNLKWALYFSRFVFQFTGLAYRTLKRYPDLGNLYLRVLEGTDSYESFVTDIKKRIRDLLGGRLSEKIKGAMIRI
jgi:geranylgeranyl reductase family protein